MLSQHSKKRDAGAPNIVPDPLVDPGNPSHRYQARSTAHLDRPCSRMVALAASSPGRRSPCSPQTTNATVMLGSVLPLTRSATGLVYLAFSDSRITAPVVERELAAHALPIDRDELASRVEATRAQGFAAVGGLLIPGLAAICAPVFDFQNELACKITVTGTDVTITDPAGQFVEQLCSSCARISAEIAALRLIAKGPSAKSGQFQRVKTSVSRY
jgi:DNA-binding IclR family transcriptional regulator